MITSDALAEWLGDGSARASTERAMQALSAEIAALPAFAALRERLASAGGIGSDAVLALARAFIEDDGGIDGLIGAALAAAKSDPMCRPPLRSSRNDVQDGLLLFSHPLLVVQLAVLDADALAIRRSSDGLPPVSFTGQRTLFRFLKGGDALLSVWEAPPADAGFSAAGDLRCRLRERRRLADGEMIEFDGRREAFVVERARSDLVYLFASTSVEASPVATEYDPLTLRLTGASSTDDAGSRTQLMLALLRTMRRRDAAPLFAERLLAPHFHVRWQTMREYLGLDPADALPHLRRMAGSDPHSEVRAAAAETLDAFFAEPSQPCPA